MINSEIEVPEFDLRLTLESGQVFHWLPEGNGWRGLIGRIPAYVEQRGSSLYIRHADPNLVAHYFALDHDLEKIYRHFPDDPSSRLALTTCRGLRIIRQPRWECLATFITSPMKQVSHIRAMSLALRARFGEAVPDSPIAAYPEIRRLARVTESQLRACGLGFRAPLLLAAARYLEKENIDLDAWAELPTADLLRNLRSIPGIGSKVANCILLFAYERLDAVPIDVWIGRILRNVYLKRKRRITQRMMEEFAARHFGPYAGYVQQYLFHHARSTKRAA